MNDYISNHHWLKNKCSYQLSILTGAKQSSLAKNMRSDSIQHIITSHKQSSLAKNMFSNSLTLTSSVREERVGVRQISPGDRSKQPSQEILNQQNATKVGAGPTQIQNCYYKPYQNNIKKCKIYDMDAHFETLGGACLFKHNEVNQHGYGPENNEKLGNLQIRRGRGR